MVLNILCKAKYAAQKQLNSLEEQSQVVGESQRC